MNENLKVSFYLKREQKRIVDDNPVFPIVGKIIIGKSIAQFSSKLKVDERLWNVKSGRAIGKSHVATMLNREINKIIMLLSSFFTQFRTIKNNYNQVFHALIRNFGEEKAGKMMKIVEQPTLQFGLLKRNFEDYVTKLKEMREVHPTGLY
jgi:hypothetical protein